MWFFKKKAKGRNFTDEERELAAEARKKNRALKDIEFEISKAKLERTLLENQLKVAELEEEFEEEEKEDMNGLFSSLGIGEAELLLFNTITQGKFFNNLQQKGVVIPTGNETPPPIDTQTAISSDSAALLERIPTPMLNELRKLPKEDLHAFVNSL